MDFETANKVMHPVEKEWHYPVLARYGYTSPTPPQEGFVRAYFYNHPKGRIIRVNTGVSCDYWEDLTPEAMPPSNYNGRRLALWGELEPYLQKIHGKSV